MTRAGRPAPPRGSRALRPACPLQPRRPRHDAPHVTAAGGDDAMTTTTGRRERSEAFTLHEPSARAVMAASLLVLIALVVPARATRISGGNDPRTDCYAE